MALKPPSGQLEATGLNADFPAPEVAWRAAVLLTMIFTIAFVHRIGLSMFVEPMKASLSLSDTQVGLLTGAFFAIPYTLAGLPLGWIVDRGHRLRLLGLSSLVWSAATAVLGMVTSFAYLALARIVTGVGQAAVQPASASLLADFFDPSRRGRAYGMFITGTAFGTAGAYLLGALSVRFGALVEEFTGMQAWRTGLIFLAAIGLFVPLILSSIREPLRHERAGETTPSLRDLVQFVRRRGWVLTTLFLGVTLVFLAPYGQLAFMPALFSRKYGWSADELALAYSIIAVVAGGGGALVGGWLGDVWQRRGIQGSAWHLCWVGGLLSLIPAAVAPLADNPWVALALYGAAGVFANWPAVGVLAAIVRLAPNELRGQITGLQTAVVGIMAAGFGPVAVGVLTDTVFHDEAAIDRALATTSLVCAMGAALAFALGWRAYTTYMVTPP